MKEVIFTDLDGTLLDRESYSFLKAKKSLELIRKRKVPLIICSSKTRSEIEMYRSLIKNKDPFISENGGGIFIPKNYFDFKFKYDDFNRKYIIIRIGERYKNLIKALRDIEKKYSIKSFNEMTLKELMELTSLDLKQAVFSKQREFDEPFLILKKSEEKKILNEIKRKGFLFKKGGRFYHILKGSDKGKAVRILIRLFKRKFKKIKSIGIGDSENDFDMLNEVDEGYLVKKRKGIYASHKFKKAKGVGPAGFNWVVKKILK